MAIRDKIDSNVTGLRYVEEDSIGTLPGSPTWNPLEPNSYSDFGAEISTTARNPINATRQQRKGVVTDLDSSGGFNSDLTQSNLRDILQGFFFADIREKNTFEGEVTAVSSGNTYDATGIDADFVEGDLVYVSGFSTVSNNGLKTVAADDSTSDTLPVEESLTDEGPVSGVSIRQAGFEFASGDLEMDNSGDLPTLVTTSKDLTTLGLIPGEWLYVGGDTANSNFGDSGNNGWVRIKSVSASEIVLDKTTGDPVTDDGSGGEEIQVFMGRVLKNEADPSLIVQRSYQLERTLGQPDTAQPSSTQAEYLIGAVANEFDVSFSQAEKVTADLGFIAVDHETRDVDTGVKSGDRPDLESCKSAFNTTSDFSRLRLSEVTPGDPSPTPLVAFLTDFNVAIANNVSANKAIGQLGAFDVTAGNFDVSGSLTAYFSTVDALAAIRNNADVTLDFALAKDNAGIVVDIPLMTLSGGQLNVEQDEPITIPLEQQAAANCELNHTLLAQWFDYLPDAAE